MPFQSDAFQGDAFQLVPGPNSGTISVSFVPPLVASIAVAVTVAASVAVSYVPPLTASVAAKVEVAGAIAVDYVPPLVASFTAESEGNPVINPVDLSGGVAHLVEIQGVHRQSGAARMFCFASCTFNSLPTDTPANQHYADRVKTPGSYSRSLFSAGSTSGEIEVGAGYIELSNVDGELDEMRDYAFDGYGLRILSVSRLNPVLAEARRLFSGTVEQIELTWDRARVLIRDRLAELDVNIQTVLFAGTTDHGGMNEAEGLPDDLKGKPKPLTYGAPPHIVPAAANTFDKIYAVGADGVDAVAEVRDRGVLIPYSGQDFTTVSGLRTASVPPAQFATARNLGLFRLGSKPEGQITVAPVVGADAAARTAGQLARRVLLRGGFIEGVHFRAKDIAKLDELNSAEIGLYVDTEEQKTLDVVRKILGSIGATIVPDRLGVYRMLRFDAPTAYPAVTFTEADLLTTGANGGRAIQSLPTADEGRGVPAWKVTVKYRHNSAVMTNSDLNLVSVTDAFKAFASEEWRTVTAVNNAVKAVDKLSPELTFETYLLSEAAAQAEANRKLALHSVPRDLFQIAVRSEYVEGVDLNSSVAIQLNRFGLDAGKKFAVIGIDEDHASRKTTLDLWG